MAEQNNNVVSEIKITNVPNSLKTELTNIAKNHGVELGSWLKPKLRELANTYPQRMREAPSKD
jgi:hypothetical protein